MPKIEIPKQVLEDSAVLLCTLQVNDKNPESLRKIADLIEFWMPFIPKKSTEKKVVPKK